MQQKQKISNGMKKSLLITYFFSPEVGGIQNYLYHLCNGLDADKIFVLTDKKSNNDLKFDKEQKFRIYRKNFFSKFIKPSWFFLFFKVIKIIKKEKIEFLQFGHYHEFCLVGAMCKILFKLHYLIYFHGIDLFIVKKSRIKTLFFKIITKKAKIVVANSNFIKNELIKFGLEEKKIKVITPAVESEKFDLSAKNDFLIKKYNLQNKKIILSIGRLTKIKGFDLAIKAMPQILKEVPDAVYLIIGGESGHEYKKELEELISRLNLKNYVFFLGEIEDKEEIKSQYYNLAEIIIMPSREIKYNNYSHIESFGIVALEAQAMEKPIIAAKIGGIGENILDQQTGILFPAENLTGIAFSAIRLLKNKNLSSRMGKKGRKRIKQEFKWIERIEKLKCIISI